MSDTVSNLDDVEDVLSSIRRLVSETSEATKPPTSAMPSEEDQDDAPAQPALVLTSAQRIDQPAQSSTVEAGFETDSDFLEPADATMEQTVEIAGDDLDAFDSADAKPVMLDSLRKAVAGAFEEEQRAFLPESADTSETVAEVENVDNTDRTDGLSASWPVRPPEDYYEDEADKASSSTDDWLADETSDSEAETTTDGHSDESTDAPAEEAEADVWFDPELDPTGEAVEEPYSTAQIHHFDPHMTVVETGWTDEGEIIDASEIVAVDPASEDEMEYEDSDLQDAEAGDGDSPPGIAAFLEGDPTESVIENGIQDAELADDDDVAEDVAEEAATPDVSAAAGSLFAAGYGRAADTEDDDSDDEPAHATDELADIEDGTLIDEEALRDMVSEIVRQELTGEMGERITRNIRKLVRREIHRALMTREFD